MNKVFQGLEKQHGRFSKAWKTALALLGLVVFLLPLGARAATDIIKEIHVERRGGGAAESASVLAFVSAKVGDEINRNVIAKDVKSLQKSERFSYVETKVERVASGYSLTFVVDPKLRIRRLEIVGADYLGNKKVRELLELGAGDIADDATIAAHALKVHESYHKKYFPETKLTWTITPVTGMDVADVRIEVREGARATVKEINFVGNDHVSARQLRRAMKQQREWWLSFITDDGTYNPDDVATDREALRRAYLDRGYLDVEVSELTVRPAGKKGLSVDAQITEGAPYHVSGVSCTGVTKFAEQDVLAALRLQVGELAAMTNLERNAQIIRDYYGARGYIRTGVDININTDTHQHTAAIVYGVREGLLSSIRNIRIRGNTRTKDKVIRRELTVSPGELFNEVRVRNSQKRLQNMGYFKFVDVTPLSTSKTNEYDLAVDVEEDRTGQFMVGAGFSSIDSLVGFMELSQGNFDLFNWPYFTGGGQKLKLRLQGGSTRRDVDLSFVEPYFLDHRLLLGVDLYQHDSFYYSTEYNQKDTGGRLTLGQPLGGFDRLNYIYGLDSFNIYDVSTNASTLIQQEAGARVKSSFTLELVHDSRDKVFVPTSGNRTSFSAQLAGGPLGGDTDEYGFQARSTQFFPLWFDHVLNVRGQMAVVDSYGSSDRVPLFDRLFLGGPQTLRGFKYREVGPTDGAPNYEPIGGQSMAFASAEYTLPIVEKVRLAGFYDVGMSWQDAYYFNFSHLNSDVGLGIRLDFPGFPIQLDYAWPIHADDFNNHPSGRFSFSIGYVY
ncbi:MAG: outer membrane protein assembly factor BamA [Verrucomicrobia bacterium]|nr:MAG: outer membrane protein assembly factor BamA [Verrucomicrobiota bacterium]